MLASCGYQYKGITSRTLRTDSTEVRLNYLTDVATKSENADHEIKYYWIRGGQIMCTTGGFDGQRLHGLLTEYYHSGQLKSKGNFFLGQKHGLWSEWHSDGSLKSVGHYRKGILHGHQKLFTPGGKLISDHHYKHGLLHGPQFDTQDSTTQNITYRKGKIKKPTTLKKESKEQQITNPSEAPMIYEMPETNQPKSEKKKSFLKKKQKTTPENNGPPSL